MAKKTPQTPQARAARDALLNRAEWIINANILAACGYTPVLPPDLIDFSMERNMDVDGRALAALLKGVLPGIELKDDRAPHMIPPDGPAIDRCRWYIQKHAKGAYSQTELDDLIRVEWNQMEAEDRRTLTDFITNAKKANPEKFSH